MFALLVFFCQVVLLGAASVDTFDELLTLQPLEDGSLFAEIRFDIATPLSNTDDTFYELFPKSIGELFTRFDLWEFDLTLTKGRWFYDKWGAIHRSIAPYGADLRATFMHSPSESSSEMEQKWLDFQHILSGLYCASINEIGRQNHNITTVFEPNHLQWLNQTTQNKGDTHSQYYGTLPTESVCTENLTPWSKLLPCRRHGGLSRLLNPVQLFSAVYQSLQVRVHPICKISLSESGQCPPQFQFLQFVQSFTAVFDTRNHRILEQKSTQLNVRKLFSVDSQSVPLLEGCPVATTSHIAMIIPQWVRNIDAIYDLIDDNSAEKKPITPLPSHIYASPNGDHHWIYPLHIQPLSSLQWQWSNQLYPFQRGITQLNNNVLSTNLPFAIERYVTGTPLMDGGLVVKIRNIHPTLTIRFAYFDPFPSWLKIYFHTLKFSIDGQIIDAFSGLNDRLHDLTLSFPTDFDPEMRRTPGALQFVATLEASAQLSITVQFQKRLLHMNAYPPDYNRGFDIGSSVIRILDPPQFAFNTDYRYRYANNDSQLQSQSRPTVIRESDTKSESMRIYLPQLLILLPYPDMSMVFNVIAFSSTLFAFFFGTAFNNLYRDVEDLEKKNIDTVKEKLLQLYVRIRDKCKDKCKKKEKDE